MDEFLQMLDDANRIALAAYPGCDFFEADGMPSSGSATQPADLTKWRFVFKHPVSAPGHAHTVYLENDAGQFGQPTDSPHPFLGDEVITLPVPMGLTEAVQLKDQAGYTGPFSATVLRWPVYPGVVEPSYIFDETSESRFVFVGVYSKRVTTAMRRSLDSTTSRHQEVLMGSIYVLNRMYSDMHVYIVGPDGGMGLLLVPAGSPGTFLNCPPWDFALMAFDVGNNSLQYLGKARPSLAVYDLVPNQGADRRAEQGHPAVAGPSSNYQRRQR